MIDLTEKLKELLMSELVFAEYICEKGGYSIRASAISELIKKIQGEG